MRSLGGGWTAALVVSCWTVQWCEAQRTRFTFGRFQLRFGDEDRANDESISCDGPWDETAEGIRSGAEDCLRTVPCEDFPTTPFYVGLGNVECDANEPSTFVVLDGAMDFNDASVPLDSDLVEACVRTVLQSPLCIPIFGKYDARITDPASFTSRRYPELVNRKQNGTAQHPLTTTQQSSDRQLPNDRMTVPVSFVAGACTAVVAVGVVCMFLLHRRRRRRRRGEHSSKEKELSTTNLDMTHNETANDDTDNDVESGLVLISKSNISSPEDTESEAGVLTPITIHEADASFDSEAIEVGLEETMVTPKDTSAPSDSSPTILIPIIADEDDRENNTHLSIPHLTDEAMVARGISRFDSLGTNETSDNGLEETNGVALKTDDNGLLTKEEEAFEAFMEEEREAIEVGIEESLVKPSDTSSVAPSTVESGSQPPVVDSTSPETMVQSKEVSTTDKTDDDASRLSKSESVGTKDTKQSVNKLEKPIAITRSKSVGTNDTKHSADKLEKPIAITRSGSIGTKDTKQSAASRRLERHITRSGSVETKDTKQSVGTKGTKQSAGTRDTKQSVASRKLKKDATTANPCDDDAEQAPTLTKEAATSADKGKGEAIEVGLGDAIEVGLGDATAGLYDNLSVGTSLLDAVAGSPTTILSAEESLYADRNTLQSFQLDPFAETSYEERTAAIRPYNQSKKIDANNSKAIIASLQVPGLQQMSDDQSDDSLFGDLRSENEGMLEILSEGCASTMAMESDHEFEPDAYWDPDDNSISTADAAGLVAMGTGESSFQPTTTNDTGKTPSNLQQQPRRSLYNWICDAPAICTSSSASLPGLLGKRPETVHQRTKSTSGTPA